MDGWKLDGWMGRWVDGKAGLRIAYSNQKIEWSHLKTKRLNVEKIRKQTRVTHMTDSK